MRMAVKAVKVHRQQRSTTIAACFHSAVNSVRSSSARILPVTVLSSPRIASRAAWAGRQVRDVLVSSWQVQTWTGVVVDVVSG